MSLEIRRATPQDLGLVGELTAHAYLADDLLSPEDEYLDELRDAVGRAGVGTVLVAVDDGQEGGRQVVGTVTLAEAGSSLAEIAVPGEVELRMLAVAPDARGRGVGEALLRAALEHGTGVGAQRVVLSTLVEMRAAQRMYQRLGLRRVPARDWSAEGYSMVAYTIDL
ncbi:GNAT family N-acetyltransferase [Actinotalea sp. C106]|uniref:GNAT family N-acetyltransferase n=1 Tax=Actinotalea sp. C106 TaxID=2908644 RepID=UPI0020295CE8|nr:GNAT family N-acetyltransferase [Actinotalea sp. C106]